MKHLNIGILAHVDAGKTTLSEGMLFRSGSIKKMGRVDNKDAFLDTFELERARGITIFSKQAELEYGEVSITLLDTPGHVDFSAEMERTLQVIDYAVLVVSGADGVQGHTRTLWHLLEKYDIPVFIFVNKMDQNGTNKEMLMHDLQKRLNNSCINFMADKNGSTSESFYENIALCDENLLGRFLENGKIEDDDITRMISARKIFPCYFGAALRLDGVDELLSGIEKYSCQKLMLEEFGARVFKIVRDEQGNRLTYMKITGGSLKVKSQLSNLKNFQNADVENVWEEKVNQIRIYSGEKFTAVNEVGKGYICAVTGLSQTFPGQGFGIEEDFDQPFIRPMLTYKIELPSGCDPAVMLPKLRLLEEEEPELHIVWDEKLQEIQTQIMGEIQIEILKSLILERFGLEVGFGKGNILYRETIANEVEGVGHFEPLRHYAEVHLNMKPGESESGLVFESDCSEDILDRNWQRLILSHLREKDHAGALIGAPVTDMKITLVSGRAHQKHTEGGDFRQAVYRAVRHGLMQAESVLLEPYYEFLLEVPENTIGRAMNDIEKMKGTFELAGTKDGMTMLSGSVPVVNMRGYHTEVVAYTKGFGRLFCSYKGYGVCHNALEVISASEYDPERDTENPSGSVFCANGSGFTVSWENVKDYMHLPFVLKENVKEEQEEKEDVRTHRSVMDEWIDDEEIDAIMKQTFYANSSEKTGVRRRTVVRQKIHYSDGHVGSSVYKRLAVSKEKYLLVDGYNIIFAWDELKELAKVGIDAARGRLLDIMSNYQGVRNCTLIVVFDAYKIKGHETEVVQYNNISIVYTKQDETADQYIERFAYENEEKYSITVATSDGLEQMIIRGKGCRIISARELETEIIDINQKIIYDFRAGQEQHRNLIADSVPKEMKEGNRGNNK